MQASADAAAFSAALEMTRINDDTLAKSRAKLDAQENAYDPTTGDIIEVNSPPKYGPYSGNNAAFEAIVSRPSPSFLSRLIHGEQVTVTARAVAIVANPGGTPCVLTLDPDMPDAIKVNNGTLNAGGCRVHANSTDPGALHVFSGGELDADDVDLVVVHAGNGQTARARPLRRHPDALRRHLRPYRHEPLRKSVLLAVAGHLLRRHIDFRQGGRALRAGHLRHHRQQRKPRVASRDRQSRQRRRR
jgi:hypothetical protein